MKTIFLPIVISRLPAHAILLGLVSLVGTLVRPLTAGNIRLIASEAGLRDELKYIAEALALIERHDPRRFQRVLRTIKRICVARWKRFVSNAPTVKLCLVQSIPADAKVSSRTRALAYAFVIIYCATEGYFYRRGIPWTRANASRIKRACAIECTYFLRHFPKEGSEAFELIRPHLRSPDPA